MSWHIREFWKERKGGKPYCLQFLMPDGLRSESARGGVTVAGCSTVFSLMSVGDDQNIQETEWISSAGL